MSCPPPRSLEPLILYFFNIRWALPEPKPNGSLSPADIMAQYPQLLMWGVGLLCCKLVMHMMLAHLCHSNFNLMRKTLGRKIQKTFYYTNSTTLELWHLLLIVSRFSFIIPIHHSSFSLDAIRLSLLMLFNQGWTFDTQISLSLFLQFQYFFARFMPLCSASLASSRSLTALSPLWQKNRWSPPLSLISWHLYLVFKLSMSLNLLMHIRWLNALLCFLSRLTSTWSTTLLRRSRPS